MSRFYSLLAEAVAEGQPVALCILTAVRGSSPQKPGAKAICFGDGRSRGTLGGGCLEAEVHRRAQRALRTRIPETFELLLDHDFGWDDGLICGGTVKGIILPQAAEFAAIWQQLAQQTETLTWGIRPDFSVSWLAGGSRDDDWLYRECVSPPCSLWIAGAGHIAQAVAPLAVELEFAVTVFDDRPTLVNPDHFPTGSTLRVGDWETMLSEPFPARTVFGLIVTRGHQHDALVLRDWIQKSFAFLGMIGSARKRRIIFDRFVQEQLATPAQLERVACPVGLPIDAVSPKEIAVSILAQYVQKRAQIMARVA